jgi:LmbE family N-acetylglucosaminyl deacetylase
MAYPDLIEKGLEPHIVQEVFYFGAEDINYHSDISTTFDKKVAALKCHASQIKDLGNGDFEGWLRNRARQLAAGSRFELAEAFHRVKLPG